MRLYYYKDPIGNFGDDLNTLLWEKIWPDYSDYPHADWLVGIGSILTAEKLDILPGTKLIMGSGYWPIGDGKPGLTSCRVGFVRGPLTCRALGLPEQMAITDPAAVLSSLMTVSSRLDERVGFMPHHLTHNAFDCAKIAEMAGMRYIDPTGPVEHVLSGIIESPKILVEAMHGAIVADAMGIPWQRISIFNRKIMPGEAVDFKWQDWGASLGVDTTPAFERLLPWPGRNPLQKMFKKTGLERMMRRVSDDLRAVTRKGRYTISRRQVLSGRVNQLLERITGIKIS